MKGAKVIATAAILAYAAEIQICIVNLKVKVLPLEVVEILQYLLNSAILSTILYILAERLRRLNPQIDLTICIA